MWWRGAVLTELMEEGDMASLWGEVPSRVRPTEQCQAYYLGNLGVSTTSLGRRNRD